MVLLLDVWFGTGDVSLVHPKMSRPMNMSVPASLNHAMIELLADVF